MSRSPARFSDLDAARLIRALQIIERGRPTAPVGVGLDLMQDELNELIASRRGLLAHSARKEVV